MQVHLYPTKTPLKKTIKEFISAQNLPKSASLLIKTHPKESLFYLLPKIHKANNPGRPIVSACSCPTEHISTYLDYIFQPIVKNLPTYIKDTTHALHLLQQANTKQYHPTFLFTLDVVSLYTSIPHSDGLRALQHFLDQRPIQDPPTSTLIRLAELVLNMNTFNFGKDIFTQISGVAMGTKMGPSYACLFMGYLENSIISQYRGPLPTFYHRYIDDGLGYTTGTKGELESFIQFVQKFHPAIKFTFTISALCATFLDINVTLSHGLLSTSVHFKPTDAHCYLDYRSSYITSTKNSAFPVPRFSISIICALRTQIS